MSELELKEFKIGKLYEYSYIHTHKTFSLLLIYKGEFRNLNRFEILKYSPSVYDEHREEDYKVGNLFNYNSENGVMIGDDYMLDRNYQEGKGYQHIIKYLGTKEENPEYFL